MIRFFVIKFSDNTYHVGGNTPYGTSIEKAKFYNSVGQAKSVVRSFIKGLCNGHYGLVQKDLLTGATIEEMTFIPNFHTVIHI